MQHKITERQLTALVAIYVGASPTEEPHGIYGADHPDPEKAGKPYWRRRTSMGGAVGRMMEALRDGGFISDPYSFERGKPYHDSYGQLTVKGYEALAERLDRLPKVKDHRGDVLYSFEIDAAELEQRKQARADREVEMQRLRKEDLDAERAERAAAREQAKTIKLAKLRELFSGRGLADNWSDEELLEFADRVASV